MSYQAPFSQTTRVAGRPYTDRSGICGISITATAVPEPATSTLMGVGFTFGAILFFRRRS